MPRSAIAALQRHHEINEKVVMFGRGERIRTSGLYVPNVALYQAKLHPENSLALVAERGRVTQDERSTDLKHKSSRASR
jgi:hypothetical protein